MLSRRPDNTGFRRPRWSICGPALPRSLRSGPGVPQRLNNFGKRLVWGTYGTPGSVLSNPRAVFPWLRWECQDNIQIVHTNLWVLRALPQNESVVWSDASCRLLNLRRYTLSFLPLVFLPWTLSWSFVDVILSRIYSGQTLLEKFEERSNIFQ